MNLAKISCPMVSASCLDSIATLCMLCDIIYPHTFSWFVFFYLFLFSNSPFLCIEYAACTVYTIPMYRVRSMYSLHYIRPFLCIEYAAMHTLHLPFNAHPPPSLCQILSTLLLHSQAYLGSLTHFCKLQVIKNWE